MMNVLIESINSAADRWAAWLVAASLDATLLLAVIGLVWFAQDQDFQLVITHPSGFAHIKSTSEWELTRIIHLEPWCRVKGRFGLARQWHRMYRSGSTSIACGPTAKAYRTFSRTTGRQPGRTAGLS